MPPRKHKRKFDDEDEELDKKEQKSKWADLLKQNEPVSDDEEEMLAPKKEIFQFDFSKEHLLLRQKDHVPQEKPKIQLTEEEKAELERILEKQRVEKEEKEKMKRERKLQKKKQLQKQKQEQQAKKLAEEKEEKQLEVMVQKSKGNSDSKKILMVLVVVMIALALLQYQKDIYAKLSKFRIVSEVNLYEVLEVSSGVSDTELRNRYKQLVIKYHPDKNPNCHTCKQKFNSIMEAWQVLGNAEKRKHYDQNSGFITQIQSNTIQLTPDNYDWLVSDSDWLWLIQVYDSTDQYSHYFASFWEDFAQKNEGLVKLGRVDVWQQPQMKGYIPYKFQLFPGLYTIKNGQDTLCQFDYDRPMRSLQLCVEQAVSTAIVTKIKDWSEMVDDRRVEVVLGGAIKLSTTLKIINSRFDRYVKFYQMEDSSTTVKVRGRDFKFQLVVGSSKKIFKRYTQFLEGLIKQVKSGCQIHYECKERPCLLLLDDQARYSELLLPFPLYQVREQRDFEAQIQQIKNLTGLPQRFQVGYYRDGKIQLGYLSELQELNPQNGEVIDFVCRRETLVSKVLRWYQYVVEIVSKY